MMMKNMMITNRDKIFYNLLDNINIKNIVNNIEVNNITNNINKYQ